MITYGKKSRKKSMVFKPDSRDHKTKQSFQDYSKGREGVPQVHGQGQEVGIQARHLCFTQSS